MLRLHTEHTTVSQMEGDGGVFALAIIIVIFHTYNHSTRACLLSQTLLTLLSLNEPRVLLSLDDFTFSDLQ